MMLMVVPSLEQIVVAPRKDRPAVAFLSFFFWTTKTGRTKSRSHSFVGDKFQDVIRLSLLVAYKAANGVVRWKERSLDRLPNKAS